MKKTTKKRKPKKPTNTEINKAKVANLYKEIDGFTRRIIHLFDTTYFRVNYINNETGYINKSHFVHVTEHIPNANKG